MTKKNNEITLSIKNLTTKLKLQNQEITVVDNLSFDLTCGKTLAILGESGCGKSMTALSLMRILPSPPALKPEGEVIYQGKNLLQLSDREMRLIRGDRIAMIFQDPMSALNPVYTIHNQLNEIAAIHLDLYGEEADKRIIQALTEVGIAAPEQRMQDYPYQLSGGMKQRVMIAMALMCEPDILIADEPTTALDVTIQKQILDLIKKLQKKHGMSLILITHDMGVVAEMADEVIVMYASRIVEKGSVFDLFNHMLHPYTQGLFLSRPHLSNPKGRLPAIEGMVPPISQLPSGCPFHPRCPKVMNKCRQGSIPIAKKGSHETHCWLYS